MDRQQAIACLLENAVTILDYKRRQITSQVRRAISGEVFQKQLAKVEMELTKSLNDHFTKAVASAITKLQGQASDSVPKDPDKLANQVSDVSNWYRDIVNRTLPILAKGMSESATAFFLVLGIDPRRSKSITKASTATEWLNSSGNSMPPGIATDLPEWMQEEIAAALEETFEQDYWQEVAETTRNNIHTFINHGASNGWSTRRIADEIKDHFGKEYPLNRAMRVARTEAGNALNGARDAAFKRMKEELPDEVGKHITKSWLSVLGNTTRDDHANLDGEEADEDGMFNLAGTLIPWPGHWSLPPEQRINCQCSLTTEFGSDVDLEEVEELLSE